MMDGEIRPPEAVLADDYYAPVELGTVAGLQIRARIRKLFSLFLIQNICCGYSKEPSQ